VYNPKKSNWVLNARATSFLSFFFVKLQYCKLIALGEDPEILKGGGHKPQPPKNIRKFREKLNLLITSQSFIRKKVCQKRRTDPFPLAPAIDLPHALCSNDD